MAELGGRGVAQRHQGVGRETRAASHEVAGYLPGDEEGPPCPGLGQDSMGRGSGDPSQTLLRGFVSWDSPQQKGFSSTLDLYWVS